MFLSGLIFFALWRRDDVQLDFMMERYPTFEE